MEDLYNMLFRWGHILFGITWIGLLYYFNFVQTEYVKEAEDDAKIDVIREFSSLDFLEEFQQFLLQEHMVVYFLDHQME